MKRYFKFLTYVLAPIILLQGCQHRSDDPNDSVTNRQPDFELLESNRTGLEFSNDVTPSLLLNVFNYMYFYNGGGVAIADFNNDGLEDVYFTANMEPNKLFLNEGDLKFRDVTMQAGVRGMSGWTTGVTAVDINNDGMMDLYVSQVGKYRDIRGHNQLFICQDIDEDGIPHFEEKSAEYNLDLVGFGTQAAFFDYDLDGDLDMYQMNHSLHQNGTFGQRFTFEDKPHPLAGDKLMRNDDGKFTDVTANSGILSTVIGYGLGLAIGDVNLDGWPDIYVGNDFHENDYLYINQQDGTFRDVSIDQLRHTSRFSMGVDINDITNDGLSEIISLDMHPYDPYILKTSQGENEYGVFHFKLGYGYNYQYARNALQLNNGNNTFSDVGIYAGIYATDWSWAPLLFDFNNDGNKDLFVSNGIPKRMNDLDYINFLSNDEVRYRINTNNMMEADLALNEKLPEIKLPNQIFLNNGDVTFTPVTQSVINSRSSFSNGAAFADLDNDGDLDVVTNNIEDDAFIYKNLTSDRDKDNKLIRLKLKGPKTNIGAIGSRLVLFLKNGRRITTENFPVRGYQSSVTPDLFFALPDQTIVDSIVIIWPDNSFITLPKEYDQHTHTAVWQPDLPKFNFQTLKTLPNSSAKEYIQDYTSEAGINFIHEENPFIDFNREQLIPHMISAEGPALAIGDLNGDGREDVFIGSSKFRHSGLYFQTDQGFIPSNQINLKQDSTSEIVDACIVDVNNDGAADIITANGGNEWYTNSKWITPRVYINDGSGNLAIDNHAFEEIFVNAGCLETFDINGDGYIDCFIGGRSVPWKYGMIPSSYIMLNDGTGKFYDATDTYAPDLRNVGMVTDAVWLDIDADGDTDLLLAREWAPVAIAFNDGGKLQVEEIDDASGWWNFIVPADYDGDGDMDFIAGNLGLNNKFGASRERPVRMYVNDFDDNGQIEQIVTYYFNDREILLPIYADVMSQMPSLKKKFLYAKDFASANVTGLFGANKVKESSVWEVVEFANSFYENRGGREFVRHDLPQRLQYAPLQTGINYDFNNDGRIDVLLAGNFYGNYIELGRYDANYGTLMLNSPGGFLNSELRQLQLTGEFRNGAVVGTDHGDLIILCRNNGPVTVLKPTNQEQSAEEDPAL